MLNWIRRMLFKSPVEIVTPTTHAADMRESSEKRHEIVGKQAELERRLYFLSLESRADVGYERRQDRPDRTG